MSSPLGWRALRGKILAFRMFLPHKIRRFRFMARWHGTAGKEVSCSPRSAWPACSSFPSYLRR